MLSASELRIGIVYSNGSGIFTLSTSDFMDFLNEAQTNDGNVINIFPVPLTPEILEKCGFDDCTCGGYKMGFPQYKFHIDRDKEGLYYHQVRLHHLHQLQNLFFCLSGSELNIEL